MVLAGGNPLPNFQAIASLKPDRVTIVATPESKLMAQRTKVAARQLQGRPEVDIVTVAGSNDACSVRQTLERLDKGWSLSYSGGTKLMAAQARLAFETHGAARNDRASVVDHEIRYDDGTRAPLTTDGAKLKSIAVLHGHRLAEGRQPVVKRSDLKAGQPQLKALIRAATLHSTPPPNAVGAMEKIPARVRRLLERTGGYWLEQVVAGLAMDHHDEVITNPRLRIGGDGTDAPEIDVVVRDGWSVTVLSCTLDRKRAVRKLKLLEAMRRASQIGGDRAVGVLVCPATPDQCVSLVTDCSAGAIANPPLVFGASDVVAWLGGEPVPIGSRTKRT